MHKLKRPLIIFISSILIFVLVVIIFISPITKYLVHRYDEKYTGRQIKMSWAYVNPFTGYIYFRNLKIYELKSDSIFFSADGVGANIAMLKLFSKTYEISKITLNHPRGTIIQNKKDLNFNDLIKKFSSNSDTTKAPVHFNILGIKIIDGEFYYHEQLIPINYSIKSVNIESTGKRWNADTIAAKFSFLPGTGSGDIKGNFTINFKNLDYRFAFISNKLDLNIIGQYLKALTNYGGFNANLDAEINAKGNFKDQENLSASGQLAINEFHFGKNIKEDYASFDKLAVAIIELNPKNHKYLFDSIAISHPYFKYERYDYLDNVQTMFGKDGANVAGVNADKSKFNLVIEIAKYVKVLSKNFFESDYKINRLVIYKGDVKFNDFSTSEKFALELSPLTVISDSIDKNRNRVSISFKSDLKPYGNLSVDLSVNPKDSGEFDLHYNLQKLPVSMFNPYTISYTSFPLDRGTLELKGAWKVRNGRIKSDNHLIIIDPRVTKRLRNKDNKWIPMPLIMFFIRERGNVIDYEIPITGNLRDPKFHFWDVIFDVLGNIFIKPPTTPYRMEVDNIENEIEKSLTLKWEMRLSSLRNEQEVFIKRMADFLADTPEASITVLPQQYEIKEKEYILFFEAKKRYFLLTKNKKLQSFSAADSEKVDKMSVKDSSFVHYLNRMIKDSIVFTIQEKCTRLIDSTTVNVKFENLKKERKNVFVSYFKKRKVEGQLRILSDENVIPYNGFSFYKIEYEGEFPKFLIKAYQQMNELNNEVPRKKFKKERQKNDSEL
ncbi:MAG: DUF748 domain-containing protein [Bacteroidales bacterium]|nr:MAG: DUF748 domain-containing protein [Bacteroidales bacterium]